MINRYTSIENNNSVIVNNNNNQSERLGGDRATSGKYFAKSSTCVKDSAELFSLILRLIVSLEIKETMDFA